MFRKTTFQNGLRLVTEKIEGTKAVTVLVLVGAGSRYETQEIRGISHFLEHMFFKGAERFLDTKQVSEAIDSVGGEFNAFTGKEYAGYYVKVASENLVVACDVLGDMLINSKFKQEEIEKERGVILEEYNMYQDTPMYQIGWNFEQLVFGEQPLGWDQIGTKELIKSVMHDDFVAYKRKLYTPDNTVIAIAGNVEHKEAVAMVEKYFKMDADVGTKAFEFLPIDKGVEGGRVYLKEKKTEQAHIAVGFPGYSETHKDHWALKLLSVILGGNMSSRMFLGVREAKGLSYYIHTSTDNYMDGGIIVTNAGVDLTRIDEAITGVIAEYRGILDGGVPEAELAKAKAYLKGKMVLNLEDSEEFAHLLAKYELLHGQARDPEEIIKLLDAVKVEDVMRVAADLFVADKMKVAVIGPYGDEERFRALLKF
ncbi:MAG: pitrilysin family protein [Patescibacteria group bacterium]